jgi:hypothetical protein
MDKEPNWDYYFSTLSFNEFKERSPFLGGRNTPTIYSKDKKWVYLGSIDIGINIYESTNIKKILFDLESCNNLKSSGKSLYKKAQMESDIDLLRELIQNCDSS